MRTDTKPMRDYIVQHQDEYIRGNQFVLDVAKKFNVGYSTVQVWLQKYNIRAKHKTDLIEKKLKEKPNFYTTETLAKELGLTRNVVSGKISKLGLRRLLDGWGAWANVDVELIKGKTYPEVMKMFGISTYSAMSHIAKRNGWDKYLIKARGRGTHTYTKDDVRALATAMTKEEVIQAIKDIQDKINGGVKFTKDDKLTLINFNKCKLSVALSIALLHLK